MATRSLNGHFPTEERPMHFGPLELQACGENNFTLKALGLLAFRDDLLRRFVDFLVGRPDAAADEPVTLLFFTKIGEGFFREAVEREHAGDLPRGEVERRLNASLGLPEGFRWSRNVDGKLTQPAKWNAAHIQIQSMLTANGLSGSGEHRQRLDHLQDCLNTEPDLVLQWGRHLALVEIKVLSAEGLAQTGRQQFLGRLLARLLGWEFHHCLIGPKHGPRPASADCRFAILLHGPVGRAWRGWIAVQ